MNSVQAASVFSFGSGLDLDQFPSLLDFLLFSGNKQKNSGLLGFNFNKSMTFLGRFILCKTFAHLCRDNSLLQKPIVE